MGQIAVSELVQKSGTGQSSPRSDGRRMIQSYSPVSGELAGEVPAMSAEEVRAVVSRAKTAQEAWGALPVEERCERVMRFRDALVERADEVVDLIVRECGKPKHEALLHEVMVTADLTTFFAKRAPAALAARELDYHLLKHRKGWVEYVPRGVVGVISPWNFPLQLPMRDVILATLAGNSAVLKPSEVTPLIALKAKDIWDSAGLPEDVFGVVTGYGDAGAALIDSGVSMVVFTGGVATGRRVAAACGERLIPCVMELGGKAPLIACADIDVERTARGIVFGGFANAGQVCISVERVYAHKDVHDRLVRRVTELTRELKIGDPSRESVDVGAIIFPKQIEVAEKHIADALSKGAELLAGGKRRSGGQFFEPTVLDHCNHGMTVMTDEIFGPIVPFMRVNSDEEAIRLSNEVPLGLNAYVFSGDRDHGRRIAERIEAGSVLVNDVLSNGGCPDAPFGGIKNSGFGRVMGEDSLRDMCNMRHLSVDRVALGKSDPFWFPYSDKGYAWFRKGLHAMFSGGGLARRIGSLF